MQKKCKYCGKEFDATKSKRLYCSDKCKKSRWREKDKKRKYGVHMENPNAAVVDIAVKAREAGMTYGQYDFGVLYKTSHISNCPYCGRFLTENYS